MKAIGTLLSSVALLGLMLSLLSLEACGGLGLSGNNPPPPTISSCSNAGQTFADNPFRGWPVQGAPDFGFLSATYCEAAYFDMFGSHHFGVDFAYPLGIPVVATADGIVSSGFEATMGNFVRLCASGWCATYMHLSDIFVASGEVTPGTVLGAIGNTGNSTGPHLHYEISNPLFETVDPLPTLSL